MLNATDFAAVPVMDHDRDRAAAYAASRRQGDSSKRGTTCSVPRDSGCAARYGVDGAVWSCVEAGGCGLAVAIAGEPAAPPDVLDLATAATCVVDATLIVDLDRDGVPEAFPLEAFVDPAAAEVVGRRGAAAACTPGFAWYGTEVGGAIVDVLGAGDLDRDGAAELLVAVRAGGARRVAMYGTGKDAGRLARLAVVSR